MSKKHRFQEHKKHEKIQQAGTHEISQSKYGRREIVVLTSIGEGKFHSQTIHQYKMSDGWKNVKDIQGFPCQERSKVKLRQEHKKVNKSVDDGLL